MPNSTSSAKHDGPALDAVAETQKRNSCTHSKQEFRQPNDRVEFNYAKPEELIVGERRVDDAIGMQEYIRAGEDQTGEPEAGEAEPQVPPLELLQHR